MHDDDALRRRERLPAPFGLAQPYPVCEALDELVLRAVGDAFVGHDGAGVSFITREAWPEVAADVKRSQQISRCRVGMGLDVCDERVLQCHSRCVGHLRNFHR